MGAGEADVRQYLILSTKNEQGKNMKRKALVIASLLTITSTNILAKKQDLQEPPTVSNEIHKIFPFKPLVRIEKRVLPVKPLRTRLIEGTYQEKIIIKFSEKNKIRLIQDKFVMLTGNKSLDEIDDKNLEQVNGLIINARTKANRLFKKTEQKLDQEKIKGEKLSHKELTDLNSFYKIAVDGFEKEEIEELLNRLNQLNLVEIAYAPAVPTIPVIGTPADILPPTTLQYRNLQGYLDAAPVGINAQWAWDTWPYSTNSRGNGIRLTDIEFGWDLAHEDLGFANGDVLNNSNTISIDHGTAVLGEIIGADNAYGVTGVANQVDISMFGIASNISVPFGGIANAINTVFANPLRPGDVMLLELQIPPRANQGLTSLVCNSVGTNPLLIRLPVENEPAIHAAIQTATANGRIVIEAAGNGGQNLNGLFAQNSGAIIVGAGTSTAPHNPLCFSNYGTRVDVQGWGENVVTTGADISDDPANDNLMTTANQRYTSNFGGTSSASPIVAGAVADLNGYFKARINSVGNGNSNGTGRILDAAAMRMLLKNTGTGQGNINSPDIPATDPLHNIGELPNLRTAFEQGLPIAGITANGSNGTINVNSNTNVQVLANLATGGLANLDADWWVIAQIGTTSFYLNSAMQWTTSVSPVYQGGLFNLPNFTIFNSLLSSGSYTLYFGVDTLRNGSLDIVNALYFDSVVINVN